MKLPGKKYLVSAALLLVVGTGIFIIGTRDQPLVAGINRVLPQPDGSVKIYFTVTNRTDRHCYFFAYPQVLSNQLWTLDDEAGKPLGTIHRLSAHAAVTAFVDASGRTGTRRIEVKYDLGRGRFRTRTDELLRKIHVGPIPYSIKFQEFTTPPFELSPR